MADTAVLARPNQADALERVLIAGDIGKLNPEQRVEYYMRVCESVGLNPLTQPFDYLTLQGKTVLYAKKTCTDQLRSIHKISVVDMTEAERDGVMTVTVKVQNAEGRTDMDKGSVKTEGLKGDALANAIMKAATKAKRRATLSICGLGMLDETEIETIPNARVQHEKAVSADVTLIDALSQSASKPSFNSSQAKKADLWPAFVEKCRGFTDLDALEQWWGSIKTKQFIESLPPKWQTEAAEEYEKVQERLYEEVARK